MARPKKIITYFCRDLDMTNDHKIRQIMRKHGGLAPMVYQEILVILYGTGTYYLRWNDDFILDIADKLYEKDAQKIRDIFESIMDAGLFSKEIFDEHGILTSAGIQERYLQRLDNTSHRKNGIREFAVVCDNLRELSPQTPANNTGLREYAGISGHLREFAENCPPKDKDKVKDKVKGGTQSLSLDTVRQTQNETNIPPTILDEPLTEPANSDMNPLGAASVNSGAFPDNLNKNTLKPIGKAPSPILRNLAANKYGQDRQEQEKQGSAHRESGVENNTNQTEKNCITPNNSEETFGDYSECADSDPVSGVVVAWNSIFKGTDGEYRHHYISGMLRYQIEQRLKIDPDIETYRKVFKYARREFDGNGNGKPYRWTLPSVFSKENTFDQLRAWSSQPPKTKAGVRGYSDPTTYASAEEFASFGRK